MTAPATVSGDLGDSVTLRCAVDSNPAPTYTWTRGGSRQVRYMGVIHTGPRTMWFLRFARFSLVFLFGFIQSFDCPKMKSCYFSAANTESVITGRELETPLIVLS